MILKSFLFDFEKKYIFNFKGKSKSEVRQYFISIGAPEAIILFELLETPLE